MQVPLALPVALAPARTLSSIACGAATKGGKF